jgi:hypothetical protein
MDSLLLLFALVISATVIGFGILYYQEKRGKHSH